MDPQLEWQIDHLEQQFREIEPRTSLHPEAQELCADAIASQLPQLRAFGVAGSERTTLALLETWHIYNVIRSRIAEAEKVQRAINDALNRAMASYVYAS